MEDTVSRSNPNIWPTANTNAANPAAEEAKPTLVGKLVSDIT